MFFINFFNLRSRHCTSFQSILGSNYRSMLACLLHNMVQWRDKKSGCTCNPVWQNQVGALKLGWCQVCLTQIRCTRFSNQLTRLLHPGWCECQVGEPDQVQLRLMMSWKCILQQLVIISCPSFEHWWIVFVFIRWYVSVYKWYVLWWIIGLWWRQQCLCRLASPP